MNVYITPEQYELAASNGIDADRLRQRVMYGKYSIERACTEKVRAQRKGLWNKWKHLALHNNITRRQFYDRVRDNNKYMSCYEAATRPIKRGVKNESKS